MKTKQYVTVTPKINYYIFSIAIFSGDYKTNMAWLWQDNCMQFFIWHGSAFFFRNGLKTFHCGWMSRINSIIH